MLPSRSKTPAERSPASRTEVENAVRTRVCACSSTTAISRDHMICMWICDSAVLGLDSMDQILAAVPKASYRLRILGFPAGPRQMRWQTMSWLADRVQPAIDQAL